VLQAVSAEKDWIMVYPYFKRIISLDTKQAKFIGLKS
jgi:hypothetical protein